MKLNKKLVDETIKTRQEHYLKPSEVAVDNFLKAEDELRGTMPISDKAEVILSAINKLALLSLYSKNNEPIYKALKLFDIGVE